MIKVYSIFAGLSVSPSNYEHFHKYPSSDMNPVHKMKVRKKRDI